jgi:hypothetical protein
MDGERDPQYEVVSQKSSNRWLAILAVILLVGVLVSVVYVARQRQYVGQLTTANGEMRADLSRAHQELEALTAKINALMAAPAPAPAPSPVMGESAVTLPRTHRAQHVVTKRQGTDDPRWKQVQDELALHNKQLAENEKNLEKTRSDLEGTISSTRSDLEGNLSSTRNDLGQSIARNHDELVALAKKGERNFFEFDISKGRQYQHAGPISISLRKAKTKQQYCDLMLLVDDASLTKKHVNLYEPVFLYPTGYPRAVEVVVNKIGPDTVHGYISEPKYKEAEMAAAGPRPNSSSNADRSHDVPNPPAPSPSASDPAAPQLRPPAEQ